MEGKEKQDAFISLAQLIPQMEERLSRKIDHLHADTRETKMDVKRINGGLAKAKYDILRLEDSQTTCKARCDEKIEEVQATSKSVKALNWITKYPKLSITLFVLSIFTLVIVSLIAVKNDWLWGVIERLIFI